MRLDGQRRVAGAGARRRDGRPQERPAASPRTRSTRWCAPTSRCSPTREPEADHDVRRPGAPATSSPRRCPPASSRRPRGTTPAGAGRRGPRPGAQRRAGVRRPAARAARGHRAVRRPGHHAARRRRHQLPQRHRPGQERRVVRRQGRPQRRRRAASTPTRSSEITDQVGVRVITYLHSDVAAVADLLGDQLTRARRPRHGPGDGQRGPVRLRQPAPAGDRPRAPEARRPRRRTTCCGTAAPRCRCAPCCSTPGRSSSTPSATRARSPRSTCPTSTAGSRWPRGCSSSPTGSSR